MHHHLVEVVGPGRPPGGCIRIRIRPPAGEPELNPYPRPRGSPGRQSGRPPCDQPNKVVVDRLPYFNRGCRFSGPRNKNWLLWFYLAGGESLPVTLTLGSSCPQSTASNSRMQCIRRLLSPRKSESFAWSMKNLTKLCMLVGEVAYTVCCTASKSRNAVQKAHTVATTSNSTLRSSAAARNY